MSLVAVVYCQCVEQGKASTPPFNSELLVSDEVGHLLLKLSEGHEKQALKEQKYQWERSCCTHPWRQYLNEWISDWRGVQMLRSALIDLGKENFPVLLECIPLANTGSVSVEQSQQALQELKVFDGFINQGKFLLASLMSSDGRELCSNAYHQEGCVYFSEAYEFWLSGTGFKILNCSNHESVFESSHFLQAYLGSDDATIFTDKKTQHIYTAQGDIRLHDIHLPELAVTEFKVGKRACIPESFDYIVTPLKKAFQTSVAISHPVVWG
ncbi:MAG: hypothetical protein ACRCWR_09730 [Saezia sp.]